MGSRTQNPQVLPTACPQLRSRPHRDLRLMPSLPRTLQQFIRSVPVCEQTASPEALLQIFRDHQAEAVVVLSDRCYPLGVIRLSRLLSRGNIACQSVPSGGGEMFFKLGTVGGTRKAASPQQDRRQKSLLPLAISEETTISPSGQSHSPSLLEPIVVLPMTASVEEARSLLRGQDWEGDRQYCALIDEEGKFQGLLDSWQLLYAVLPELPTFAPNSLESLRNLLEQLPIPLMLQGERGQVIQQNSTWQKQIGRGMAGVGDCTPKEFLQSSQYDSKTLWENTPQNWKIGLDQEIVLDRWCNFIAERGEEEEWDFDSDREFSPTSPEMAQKANRVWQFVKLPLSVYSPPNSQPIPSKTSLPLWLVLATDVTEQRQLCKELTAKNADLVQLNRLKDEFLACISHELKTPLTAVLGLASLLKDNKLGELNKRQSRYAQLIYQSGQQLMGVVNDILDLTRIETGQLKLNLEPVNLKEVCDRAYQQARQQLFAARGKESQTIPRIDFSLTIAPELEAIVADELRLRQMLVHLLENALKFTPSGGKIGLHVDRWQGWIDFTVWDTGIGIPESAQHLIFQKFQQLESPLTRQFEGTGLGLVLTQRLARAHGGDISFTSKVGRGSKFTLLLPPAPPEREARRDRGKSSPEPNRLILIVEAVPQYIERLTGQLQKLGYRAIVARSGTEALEQARQIQPRAIFLNPLLPLLSGWDVLTLLKADSKTKNIPVIITATRADKRHAQQNDADGFLSLPVQSQALQESLSRLKTSPPSTRKNLTILHLHAWQVREGEDATTQIFRDRILTLNYRILEASDIEQAEILAKVWKPDVLLLEGGKIENADEYLQALGAIESLSCLPVITLDTIITESANKIAGLSVFPCLIPITEQSIVALLQVIQVAAGVSQQANILIIEAGNECHQLPPDPDETSENQPHAGIDFAHALTQYLQTAGLRSLLAKSWAEVYSQIQNQSVDLLIVNLGEVQDIECWLDGLKKLANLANHPPILVLEHNSLVGTGNRELDELLDRLATKTIVDNAQLMPELLTHINQMLI
ncbi:MAG: response regulator [Cyanobacteria bacterium SBLK]|nr:response regulator [Cyanobacteria bacterium SBLK]